MWSCWASGCWGSSASTWAEAGGVAWEPRLRAAWPRGGAALGDRPERLRPIERIYRACTQYIKLIVLPRIRPSSAPRGRISRTQNGRPSAIRQGTRWGRPNSNSRPPTSREIRAAWTRTTWHLGRLMCSVHPPTNERPQGPATLGPTTQGPSKTRRRKARARPEWLRSANGHARRGTERPRPERCEGRRRRRCRVRAGSHRLPTRPCRQRPS